MKSIPRDTFLDTEEVEDLLGGRVKLKTLKGHGLVGLSKGYWSNCLISALDRYCRTLADERARGASRKEAQREIFENQGPELLDRREAERFYSNRPEAHLERGADLQVTGSDSRSLESQSELFERRTKAKTVQSGKP
jgi:hypothetical protein